MYCIGYTHFVHALLAIVTHVIHGYTYVDNGHICMVSMAKHVLSIFFTCVGYDYTCVAMGTNGFDIVTNVLSMVTLVLSIVKLCFPWLHTLSMVVHVFSMAKHVLSMFIHVLSIVVTHGLSMDTDIYTP